MSDSYVVTIDADPGHPDFVASYLRVAGDECAFIETNTTHSLPLLLSALAGAGLTPSAVRYVIVTHAHLDHAGGAGALMSVCPNATLLAHPRAARNLIDPAKLIASATQVYGRERFQALYGELIPIPAHRVRALEDESVVELGGASLRFLHTRGHAKHHFVVHDPDLEAVFTGDTLGLVYPRLQRSGLFALASTSPIDFEPEEARLSIARIVSLQAETAYPTHFGGVHGKAAVARVGERVREFVDASEQWLMSATRSDAPLTIIEEQLRGEIRTGLQLQADRVGLALSEDDWASLELDIDLNAKGIAYVVDRSRAAH